MTTGKLNGQVRAISAEARKRMSSERSLLIKKVNRIAIQKPMR